MPKTFLFLFFYTSSSVKHHIISCNPSKNTIFNICFLDNGVIKKTTYENGFTSLLRVNLSDFDYIYSEDESKFDVRVITSTKNITEDQVFVSHSFTNLKGGVKKIDFAVFGDLCFNGIYKVPVEKVNNDGIYMSINGYDLSVAYPKNKEKDITNSLYIGPYSRVHSIINQFNIYHQKWGGNDDHYFEGDSGIYYTWQEIVLNTNETKTVFANFFNFRNFPSDQNYSPGYSNTEILSKTQEITNTQTEQVKTMSYTKTNTIDNIQKTETFKPSFISTASSKFTKSNTFTSSESFTAKSKFTSSESFTAKSKFTSSESFTTRSTFTSSESFTTRSKFTTRSNTFTSSSVFSSSSKFTKSKTFSASKVFTQSESFTSSNSFTKSKTSKMFTKSSLFTTYIFFSQTKKHTSTTSNDFTKINNTSETDESKKINPSSIFTVSKEFILSKTSSHKIRISTLFTPSNEFTKSNTFTQSYFSNPHPNGFTRSKSVPSSETFTSKKVTTSHNQIGSIIETDLISSTSSIRGKDTNTNTKPKKSSIGMVIGIVAAVFAVSVASILVVTFLYKKKQQLERFEYEPETEFFSSDAIDPNDLKVGR